MNTTSIQSPERNSKRQIQLVVILAVILVGVLVFRLQSATRNGTDVSSTALTLQSDSPGQTLANSQSKSTAAIAFDPQSLAIDFNYLWAANPFHRVSAQDKVRSTTTGTGATDESREFSEDVSKNSNDSSTVEIPVRSGEGEMRVSAIFDNGRERAAIIGSEIRRPGDYLNSTFRIVAIHRDRVEVLNTSKPIEAQTDPQ